MTAGEEGERKHEASDRTARLEAALKANLKKRKAQAQARAGAGSAAQKHPASGVGKRGA